MANQVRSSESVVEVYRTPIPSLTERLLVVDGNIADHVKHWIRQTPEGEHVDFDSFVDDWHRQHPFGHTAWRGTFVEGVLKLVWDHELNLSRA